MTDTGKCKRRCPGGHDCTLDDNGHTLHCCKDEVCECHSRQRYDLTVNHTLPTRKRIWRVEPLPYHRTVQARLVVQDGRDGLEVEYDMTEWAAQLAWFEREYKSE